MSLEYTGVVCSIIAAFSLYAKGTFHVILEVILCSVMLLAAILMVVALLSIRSCFVDKGLGAQVSPIRMVVHALAFLIYIIEYSTSKIIELFSKTNNTEYVGWAIGTLFAIFSYLCLFFVIWHLGSKTEQKESNTTTGSTILETNADEEENPENA